MAIEFYSVFIATCDVGKENCWHEVTLQVNDNETIEDAIDFIKELGWEVSDEYEITCPGCSKGVLKLG